MSNIVRSIRFLLKISITLSTATLLIVIMLIAKEKDIPAVEKMFESKMEIKPEAINFIETSPTVEKISTAPQISFIGPRKNIPSDSPTAYGFWSFAMPVAGVLSRSGQPLISEFQWLKEKGWRSDINLRVDNERGEVADDALLADFNSLGLNYLRLPIADGSAPTNEQAKQFLEFVTKSENQPAHVHCRGGIGRTGTMVALYRYAVQSWPMEKAIEESRLFDGGVSDAQKKWLEKWSEQHQPGEYQ